MTAPRTFQKKPIQVQAMQFDGTLQNATEILNWINDDRASFENIPVSASRYNREYDQRLLIPTLEGRMMASPGDWIIRGIQGEFYPCKPDIFADSYEAVLGL